MKSPKHLLSTLGFFALLLALSAPLSAHNGWVATAVPVSGITIDGDFSDWPADMRQYPIEQALRGDSPQDRTDFEAFFRIGYSEAENALYLAVEVTDESMVIDSSAEATPYTRDGCALLVDATHGEGATRLAIFPAWADTFEEISQTNSLLKALIAMHSTAEGRIYEWCLKLPQKGPEGRKLRGGISLGLDLALFDLDEDESSSSIFWGPVSKPSSFFIGDVVLVGSIPGILHASTRWADADPGIGNSQMQIRSLSSPELWLRVKTDSRGHVSVDLPPGRYAVQPLWPQGEDQEISISAGSETSLQLTFPTIPPRVVPAGRGKGHWQTYNVTDGLISNTVYAIHQDRNGDLWFGTEGGICRYDGRRFTSFPKTGGPMDSWVQTIAEDAQGNLWFGSNLPGKPGGLSCYDTRQNTDRQDGDSPFTHYTAADGLPPSGIKSLLVDRSGNLWCGTQFGGLSRYDTRQDGDRQDGGRQNGAFTNFSTEDGLAGNSVHAILEDRQGHLWFGTENGVSRCDDQQNVAFTSLPPESGLIGKAVYAILEDRQGHLWFGTADGLTRYDGETFTHLSTDDGLPPTPVLRLLEDRRGDLWLATGYHGSLKGTAVVRYDGHKFDRYTTRDGLAHDVVTTMLEDAEGNLWFGTGSWGLGGGVSRYSGDQFTTFGTADGLPNADVTSIVEDRHGDLWFSTGDDMKDIALSRYDGETFSIYSSAQGLPSDLNRAMWEDSGGNLWLGRARFDGRHFASLSQSYDELPGQSLWSIAKDRQNNLWFGLWNGGVSHYDGEKFERFTKIRNLDAVRALLWDRNDQLWIGSWGNGLFRWDGEQVSHFTAEDGLATDGVASLFEDRNGRLWIGSWNGGLSWYDARPKVDRQDIGKTFQTLSQEDGLAGNWINSIIQDRHGRLLFGSFGGGVSLYDGLVLQNLTTRDGLGNDNIFRLLEDSKGDIWICSYGGGLTRYRPVFTPPPVQIADVTADRSRGPIDEILLPTTQDYLAFSFEGRSFKTRPGQMAYVYRLREYEEDWRTTRSEQVTYTDLPRGEYLFEVKAVDRDLTYSEKPAQVRVVIHLPYERLALTGALGLAFIGLVIASGYGIKRRRERDHARQAFLQEQQQRLEAQELLARELEGELQTAHEMQMNLMPTESPQIEGLDIAGRCLTANHVGGDLFQYFQKNGTLAIALADITGHAMEAAIPAVMFSGILETEMQHDSDLETLFTHLNRNLCKQLDDRTFVCFTMGELDRSTRALRLANGGCPYPYHYRAATGDIAEIQVEAYPLGIRPDTAYPSIEVHLEPGDRILLCSDGIVEAATLDDELFGFERTAETIRQGCADDLSSEDLLRYLLAAVEQFTGDIPRADDQTVVILALDS